MFKNNFILKMYYKIDYKVGVFYAQNLFCKGGNKNVHPFGPSQNIISETILYK